MIPLLLVVSLFLGAVGGVPLFLGNRAWKKRRHFCRGSKACEMVLDCSCMPWWVGLFRRLRWAFNRSEIVYQIGRWARPGRS